MRAIHLGLFFFLMLFPLMAEASTADSTETNAPVVDQGVSFFAFFDIGLEADANQAISEGEFAAIMTELSNGTYQVLSLPEALTRLQSPEPIIQEMVALTFDGGYRSFFEKAWPVIKEKRLPIAIFITPEQIDRESPYFMTWDELEDVADYNFVTIGLQADIYLPYPERSTADITSGLNRAIGRFEEKLGMKPAYIAYPYGLYDEEILDILKGYTFIKGGFGLQSSVAYHGLPLLTMPRFPMAGEYGNVDRFRMLARALPLVVHDNIPSKSTMVSAKTPLIGFTLDKSVVAKKDKLACFASDIGRLEPEFLGEDRVELRLPTPIQDKRYRINCTLPYVNPLDNAENWRWYGMVIQPEGVVVEEETLDTPDDFTTPTAPGLP